MRNYYSIKLKIPFDDAVEKTIKSLQLSGFGLITTIDLKNTFKEKLDIPFRRYKILGACNPNFAYKAVSVDSHIGLLLPCNVVIQEHENGEIEVSSVNPLETIEKTLNTAQLTDIAAEVSTKLREAIDRLHCDIPNKAHQEALPSDIDPSSYTF